MAKEILNKQLKECGFTQTDNRMNVDDEIFYDWFELYKNDSKIEVAKEYNRAGEFILQYVLFNNARLMYPGMDLKRVLGLVKLM